MPLGDLGRLPSPAPASASHSTSNSSSSSPIQQQQTLYSQTHSNSSSRWDWAVSLSAALVHSSVYPLVSFESTADLLQFCLFLSSVDPATMPPGLRLPKSPIKTSVVRHDEHCKDKEHRAALDPECPICQLPIGKKSPEGVKEGYSVLPCGHVFGGVCIKTYLAITEKPQCPICRANLFHHCGHPIHPAQYGHKKVRFSPAETARKAFPLDFNIENCRYCDKRKLAHMKKMQRRQVMETTRSASGSSSSAGSAASGTTAEGSDQGVGSKATRKLKTAPHGDLDSDPSSSSASNSSNGSEQEEEDDEYGNGSDIQISPPQVPSRDGLPPVPGHYGHWDLANKSRDWKFLTWYNDQDPKINPSREHYS